MIGKLSTPIWVTCFLFCISQILSIFYHRNNWLQGGAIWNLRRPHPCTLPRIGHDTWNSTNDPSRQEEEELSTKGNHLKFLEVDMGMYCLYNSNVCESNALVKTGPLQHPTLVGKQGNISQLGGDFILGPGNVCSFAHRMQNTEDRTFLSYLFNIIYSEVKIPQMLKCLISCRLLEWLILELLVLVGTSPSFSNKCFKWTNNVRHNHNAQLQRPSEFESSGSNAR